MAELPMTPDLDGLPGQVGPITAEGKANSDSLGELHGLVAAYLAAVIKTGCATPALIGAAITFLKNNSITADPATNAKLNELSQTLKERKGKKLTPAQLADAEQTFSQMTGFGFPQ